MSKIAIHLDHPLIDGEEITFKSPCASADATGLKIYTPTSYEDATEVSAVYTLKDAGGNTLHGKSGLFASGAYVTVALDTTNAIAYVHNARSIYTAEFDTKLDWNEGDASDTRVQTITAQTASYPLPGAGNKLSTIIGKISKFLSDLKANAVATITASGKTLTFKNAAGQNLGTVTTQDTWNANSVDTNGYVAAPTSSKPWYAYMTDANGSPGWRSNQASYDHPGLFGASQYRNLFNYETDGTRTNLARKFWACTKAGNVGWYDYTATTSDPGWMSAEDKTKLDGVATGAAVSGVTHIAAGTKSSLASSTSTITTVASKTVSTAGTYLVMMTATTASAATSGYLRGVVNTSSAWGEAPSQAALNGTGAQVSSFYVYTISASTTFRALVQQSSGAAQDVKWNFAVIRIA